MSSEQLYNPDLDNIPASAIAGLQERFNRGISGQSDVPEEVRRAERNPYPGDAIYISRKLTGQRILIGTAATYIWSSPYEGAYLLVNPQGIALTTAIPVFAGTVTAIGNTQASPIDVAGISEAHLHLDITAITGLWDFYLMTYASIARKWADAQQIFSQIGVIGTYYAPVGSIGISQKVAIRWQPSVGGSIAFTLEISRKQGLGGNVASVQQTIYIGGPGVTTDSGFPLLEGRDRTMVLAPNVSLYGVAEVPLSLTIFQLS